MANLQDRKRPNADDEPSDDKAPPAKRIKKSEPRSSSSTRPGITPAGWDNLSRTWLTSRAPEELNRRNKARSSEISAVVGTRGDSSLAQFVRRGDPDLAPLRQYPEPKHAAASMGLIGFSSTEATTMPPKIKRSSAHNKDFVQILIDHNIYPQEYKYPDKQSTPPRPGNLEEIMQCLSARRASLSPSCFSESAFEKFKQANRQAISKRKVMYSILPIICGNDAGIPHEGTLPFTNLESMTEGATVKAVPDLYDGTNPTRISRIIRQDLNKSIIPTSHGCAPLAPNFFLEAKAPRGGADVARRQACLDGAYGARAMHSLQNYGQDNPVYDGNAYAYSSTYYAGCLRLYAHHPTITPGGLPEYHMTQIGGWDMTVSAEDFRRGATAFRNLRDLAQRTRDGFIQAANTRASSKAATTATNKNAKAMGKDGQSGLVGDNADNFDWREADDELQRQIALACDGFSEDEAGSG
ncbi:hypothetical protein QQS21_008630 [Conoideocrella luteorostrata]|uniref:DUF7924 domain-containing protein n=1 Tax=Conoideocrella luteorostrata TaxID=1105319 RepID=A0AAJ0CMY2_9HYPO|nr:hypothetical protein QQS21_008630 [Conoideocrella luteorostrata]